MRYFCTYFDQHYLPRALIMLESLAASGVDFEVWAFCMDREAFDCCSTLEIRGLNTVSIDELEGWDPELKQVKADRTGVEYYFTCTPLLPLYVFAQRHDVDLVTYLDADLFFFADPSPIYDELAGSSIGIIPHRFSPRVADREKYGQFNVGWLTFRRDENGMECLKWWRERCLEWCHVRVEPNRFADQKYLDPWPTLFRGVTELKHEGANLGPWNLAGRRLTRESGHIKVDGLPLIFYHFSGIVEVRPWLIDSSLKSWLIRPTAFMRRHLYRPYLRRLASARQHSSSGGFRAGWQPAPVQSNSSSLRSRIGRIVSAMYGVLSGSHFIIYRGKVL